MFFSMIAAMSLSTGQCPVERAHYALRTMPGVTARFLRVSVTEDWPVGLALRMDFAATGRSYWWLPWNGGTNGHQNLASTPDPATPGWRPMAVRPLGDIEWITADADYAVLEAVPRHGDDAPAHFLIPNLRRAMWYRTPQDRREGTTKQFFDLVRCDPPA
ncbi:hypothetical protein [Sphingomonas sp. G-3-2-10]|uniref:hypothetical protein n=1 Tax=Sphingomonas sp. G-3-2-10 TaxID=2728838 RepID=UPI00146A586C|nr:hypothetical protein [Sphingomonas sp. G-3-2-10]NML04665.1 hypothetical protein [Sphingomonas sp. G-3-2-10]